MMPGKAWVGEGPYRSSPVHEDRYFLSGGRYRELNTVRVSGKNIWSNVNSGKPTRSG